MEKTVHANTKHHFEKLENQYLLQGQLCLYKTGKEGAGENKAGKWHAK
jgi:hypothetical protein